MQNAVAVYHVERISPERRREHRCLDDVQPWVGAEVVTGLIDRIAQIHADELAVLGAR